MCEEKINKVVEVGNGNTCEGTMKLDMKVSHHDDRAQCYASPGRPRRRRPTQLSYALFLTMTG